MKFSINNLLSKYNLVLIIPIFIILSVVYIVFNANSYKEHMNNPFLKKMNFNSFFKNKSQTVDNQPKVGNQPKVDRQSVEIIPEIEIPEPDSSSILSTNLLIPVCTLFDENECSKNKYCLWNSDKKMCNKLNVCELLDNNHCNNSINCNWNTRTKKCSNK